MSRPADRIRAEAGQEALPEGVPAEEIVELVERRVAERPAAGRPMGGQELHRAAEHHTVRTGARSCS